MTLLLFPFTFSWLPTFLVFHWMYTSYTSRPFDYYFVSKSLFVLGNILRAAIWLLRIPSEFLLNSRLICTFFIILRLWQSTCKTSEIFRKLNGLKQLVLAILPHVCWLGISEDMTAVKAEMTHVNLPLVNASLDFSAAKKLSAGRAQFRFHRDHIVNQAFQVD